MAEQRSGATSSSAGDRRDADRRRGDRRNIERRLPPPPWRRPWALVAYGVIGALVVVGLFSWSGEDEPDTPPGELVTAPSAQAPLPTPTPPPTTAPRAAYTAADFEQLVIEGKELAGQRVLAELSCAPASQIALNKADRVEESIAALQSPDGRVAAAECKWGRGTEARRGDFLLLVPADMSEAFSSAPVTSDDFVRRRRLRAEVEWIGRSEALALRTAGVLRRVVAPAGA